MSQKQQKTIKLPVSEEITQEKLDKLDRLTARLTYGTELFLENVIKNDITTKSEANMHNKEIQSLTGLSSAFVQCCRDRALWMYKNYKAQHRKWRKKVAKLERKIEKCKSKKSKKKHKHKLYRLKKREPSPPTIRNKIPAHFDQRVGLIQVHPSDTAKEFDLWCRISTLKKDKRMDVPLHSYPYAEEHINSDDWETKSFQIVRRSDTKCYEVHVVVEKEVEVPEPDSVIGIDLGLKRLVTAYESGGEGDRVTFTPKEDHKEFFIQIRRLNNRIGKLQRLGKTKGLKKLKRKRRNYARDFRRKVAVEFAEDENISNSIVFIGHPQHIRTNKHYKGSGHRKNRKRVNHWAFREFAETLKTELMENGNQAYIVNEWNSTQTCSNCGSKKTQIDDRDFECLKCGYKDDRDVNGAKNILKKGLNQSGEEIDETKVLRKGAGAVVTQPGSRDDWVEETYEPTTSLS